MNAWEEGDTIFADVMEYPVAPLFPNADGSPCRERAVARLVRWTFDLAGDSNTDQAPAARRPGRRIPALRRAPRGPRPTGTAGSRPTPGRKREVALRLHRPCRSADRQARRPTRSRPAMRRASRSSCRARRTRRRATAGWSRWSIAAPRTAATSWCSTPRTIAAGPIGRRQTAAPRPLRLPRQLAAGVDGVSATPFSRCRGCLDGPSTERYLFVHDLFQSAVTEHRHEPEPDRSPPSIPAIAPRRSPSTSLPRSFGAGAALRPTYPAGSNPSGARTSTTAGRGTRRPSRSRPR